MSYKLESFDHYLNKYLNNNDFVPILFKKKCGYSFVNFFYKPLLTHIEIYSFFSKYFIERYDSPKLYLDENYQNELECNNLLFKNTINEFQLKPVYNLPERTVYILYFDEC